MRLLITSFEIGRLNSRISPIRLLLRLLWHGSESDKTAPQPYSQAKHTPIVCTGAYCASQQHRIGMFSMSLTSTDLCATENDSNETSQSVISVVFCALAPCPLCPRKRPLLRCHEVTLVPLATKVQRSKRKAIRSPRQHERGLSPGISAGFDPIRRCRLSPQYRGARENRTPSRTRPLAPGKHRAGKLRCEPCLDVGRCVPDNFVYAARLGKHRHMA